LTECHTPQQISSRKFVTTPYIPIEKGRLVAKRPTVCPDFEPQGLPCRVCLNHTRNRITGPCFPLEVLRCRTHKVVFTLYPPGHVPYGRVPLVCVSPDGSPLGEGASGAGRFEGTLFQAALDAAEGVAWPGESLEGYAVPRFPTQQRRLVNSCLLTGVAPVLGADLRTQLTSLLGVAGQFAHEGACQIEPCPASYRTQGQAVVRILDALSRGMSEFDRLTTCGYWVGLWPEPHRWHPESACLQPSFPDRIVRAPPS
jgi:hypothetical protein